MKRSSLILAAALLPILLTSGLAAPSAFAEEATLELTIDGIGTLTGQIAVAVFDNAEDYKSGKKVVVNALGTASGKSITIDLTGLAAGPCAIKIYHDVNGNGDLDSNMMGMPTEPFGFSNGAVARFGPPGFEDAVFTLSAGENSHSISLSSL